MEVTKFRSAIALADIGFAQSDSYRRIEVSNWGKPEADEAKFHRTIFENWPIIAAHAAIATLFQIQEMFGQLTERAEDDEIRPFLNNAAACADAATCFNKHFPKWKQMRHATAHTAEIRLNPDKNVHLGAMSGNSKWRIEKPEGAGLLMSECFFNRTFTTTRKGEILGFDVTWESYEHLLEVYEILRTGLSAAAAPLPEAGTSPPQSNAE